MTWLRRFFHWWNGDAAYARYLRHHIAHHSGPPLSRRAFTAAETERKWSGISRCC